MEFEKGRGKANCNTYKLAKIVLANMQRIKEKKCNIVGNEYLLTS